jgi:hypothetical protein
MEHLGVGYFGYVIVKHMLEPRKGQLTENKSPLLAAIRWFDRFSPSLRV